MRRVYKVTITKDIHILKDGEMSINKPPYTLNNTIVISLFEDSEVDVHNTISKEYKGYSILNVDKQ